MSRHVKIRRTDAAILQHLARERLSYPTVAAVDLGIDPAEARRRCEKLADEEFVEPVSAEVVYRITDRGEAVLDVYGDVAETADEAPTGDDADWAVPER